MDRTLDLIVANPAGNITIFVMTPCDRKDYQEIATKLLAMEEYKAEQVAFVLPHGPNVNGKMEMCGLEFCGNASRSFGLIIAKEQGMIGPNQIIVDVSGSNTPLTVEINTLTNYTKIQLPPPLSITSRGNGCLVDLGGILHFVLWDIPAERDTFDKIKDELIKEYNHPAIGVMFYDRENRFLTPVVYVSDIDSVYFEGSCASGTIATAVALAEKSPDGMYAFNIEQPVGTLTATLIKKQNQIHSVYIEGAVELSEHITVTI